MAFKGWEKTWITSDDGSRTTAIQPVIVSASRSTDLPAFHHEWFYNRLKKGHVVWTNPFNRFRQYVSFSKVRVFVFWTKNPQKFMDRLGELDTGNYNYYFQFTLNDYADEGLEPCVPPLSKRIDIFKRLSGKVGRQRVIWRFDPLILTEKMTVETLTDKVSRVAEALSGHTEKLVISFADIDGYQKVRRNLDQAGVGWRNFTGLEMTTMAENLRQIGAATGLEIAACAEKIDLSSYGILSNKCVDDELMVRLFPNDEKLMDFLGVGNSHSSLFPEHGKKGGASLKDRGQRKACGCIVSKDIGQYDTCRHFCAYCYANDSRQIVMKNFSGMTQDGCESIL
jgi:Domain of unknown function (DUF1848)